MWADNVFIRIHMYSYVKRIFNDMTDIDPICGVFLLLNSYYMSICCMYGYIHPNSTDSCIGLLYLSMNHLAFSRRVPFAFPCKIISGSFILT